MNYFRVANEEFVVISMPVAPPLPEALTFAEREVVRLVLEGASNATIARTRGVAVRTVANQVASAMKKLGVGSRTQLIAKLAR